MQPLPYSCGSARSFDGGLGGFHHVLGGDAQIDHVLGAVALQAELLDRDRLAIGAEVLVPRLSQTGFDGDAGLDGSGED